LKHDSYLQSRPFAPVAKPSVPCLHRMHAQPLSWMEATRTRIQENVAGKQRWALTWNGNGDRFVWPRRRRRSPAIQSHTARRANDSRISTATKDSSSAASEAKWIFAEIWCLQEREGAAATERARDTNLATLQTQHAVLNRHPIQESHSRIALKWYSHH
jgi:hypothetical protein